MKKFNPLPYILIFLATFLTLQLFQGNKQEDGLLNEGDIAMQMIKDEYAIGKDIKLEIQNNTAETILLTADCLDTPFEVSRFTSEGFVAVENNMSSDVKDCESVNFLTLESGEKETISLLNYSYTYFGEVGTYKIELTYNETTFSTPEFSIKEPGIITSVWRSLIYQPILNALVAILIYLPNHNLAIAIISLTLFIRTLLLIPSQKAYRAQRQMQEVQPKIEAIKNKHKDDQARIAQETMLIWKQHKVHPLSSCGPMLIQFPILIALYYSIRGGLSPDKASLIYDFLPTFSLADVNPAFFNFNLFEKSLIVFPILVGGLQFVQMMLMTRNNQKDGDKSKKKSEGIAKEMNQANAMMKYVMPLMIAFFSTQLPAAVGLYWGTSTFYGIIQQLVINKRGPIKVASSKKNDEEVKVRVINKKHGKTN